MSLEPCPACGYALSTLDHHCRHCLPSSKKLQSFLPFDAKNRSTLIMTLVAFSILLFWLLFR